MNIHSLFNLVIRDAVEDGHHPLKVENPWTNEPL